MEEGGIRAAKNYVEVSERHTNFVDECKEIENKFKSEVESAKDVLAVYTSLTPAARLPDGRLVRTVTNESVLSITEERLRGAFADVNEENVVKQGGVLNAVLNALRQRCLSISESVKITKDTKGLPAKAFPIPAAPENIKAVCDDLDQAEMGIKAVRKHKRSAKKDTEAVMSDFYSKVETAYVETARKPPPTGSPQRRSFTRPKPQSPPRYAEDEYKTESDKDEEEEMTPPPRQSKRMRQEPIEQLNTPQQKKEENNEVETPHPSPSANQPTEDVVSYAPLVITKPPCITLPGEVTATPLPKRPTKHEVEEIRGSKKIVESDIVDSDIRVRMVESKRKGRSPSIKQFAGTLDKLLNRVRTYKTFNDRRLDLMEEAVEDFNTYREKGTQTSTKIKIDKPKEK
jgi:hypothetical protein